MTVVFFYLMQFPKAMPTLDKRFIIRPITCWWHMTLLVFFDPSLFSESKDPSLESAAHEYKSTT